MIADNKYVLLHYVGSFENGKVFDSSINKTPFEFLTGANQVIPGFEEAVRSMEINEEKEVVISPDKAYGEYDNKKKRRFPLEELRKSFEPKVGMTIGIKGPQGQQIPGVVTDVTEHDAEIDVNHPFAGKTLKFKLILLEVNDTPKYGGVPTERCDDCSCDGEPESCENK